jgi:hypothetical protein
MAPNIAAIVVMTIGRDRGRQAWKIAYRDDKTGCVDGKVDHENGVLLHDADKQDDSDQRDDAELDMEQEQRKHHSGPRRCNS